MWGMTPEEIRSEDVRKIHAEINQIVNQRHLLTTVAVTVFGGLTAWLLPKYAGVDSGDSGAPETPYMAATIILLLLGLLYGVSHGLKRTLRIFTTYLEVFELSSWEDHWRQYRKKGHYVAYTKVQTRFFLILALLLVVISAVVQPLAFESWTLWLELGVFLVYCTIVSGIGFRDWWDHENDVRNRWKEIRGPGHEPVTPPGP